jgi:UDP-glucose 4-epimerase
LGSVHPRRPVTPIVKEDLAHNGKALVTGGSGFLGSHLCEHLIAKGWEVYALDDLSTGSLGNVGRLLKNRRFHLVVDTVLSRTVVNERAQM